MTDIEDDNKFHLLDGESYDPSDLNQQALYYWSYNQPTLNKGQLCGFIFFQLNSLAYGIDNFPCNSYVCYDKPIKGICEICESWKL